MRCHVRETELARIGASVLGACAATAPAASNGAAAANTGVPESHSVAAGTGAKFWGDYQQVFRNGQEPYCKREAETGSRTTVTETCLTKALLIEEQEHTRNFATGLQNSAVTPMASPNAQAGIR
ncbi:MAG TPA: hypothetical protein VMC02_13620 [Steroidobacteraceae bacterium]|nr:hypothetical protein [Steroidobacteraceae bacterium]